MGKNKKIVSAGRAGFTLIEILVIITIIGILVTVVLVSLFGSQQKAHDNSVFASFKSAASPAFVCLSSGVAGARLNNPTAGTDICSVGVIGESVWPDFSRDGWSNGMSGTNRFFWCAINSNPSVRPTVTGAYNGTSIGGSGSGEFCFMLRNDTKYMWCTLNGCGKEGF